MLRLAWPYFNSVFYMDKALVTATSLLITYQRWRQLYKDALSKLEYVQERRQRQEQLQQNLYTAAALVRAGQHLPYLEALAHIYFGLFIDSEREGEPVMRLKNEIGADLTGLALEGFQAVLLRHDLPSLASVAELRAENRHYPWWYTILAGMDEKWRHARCLDVFPEAALEAALCLAFELPTCEYNGNTSHPTVREWPDRILIEFLLSVQS